MVMLNVPPSLGLCCLFGWTSYILTSIKPLFILVLKTSVLVVWIRTPEVSDTEIREVEREPVYLGVGSWDMEVGAVGGFMWRSMGCGVGWDVPGYWFSNDLEQHAELCHTSLWCQPATKRAAFLCLLRLPCGTDPTHQYHIPVTKLPMPHKPPPRSWPSTYTGS